MSKNKRYSRGQGDKARKAEVRTKRRGDSKEEAVEEDSATTGSGRRNDPNWYFTDAEVAAQAGQLSFQNFLGTKNTFGEYTMPTLMAIGLNPSPGNTGPGAPFDLNNRAGFNMSMTKMFNKLSMKSGRNMAYAPQDVGAATLGMGELLSQISYCRRLFGIVKWWNVRNRMVPKQIIKAMGIDPDDFFKYFSDYRMRLNAMIVAANQIPILTNSGYLRKCASLYDNIYVDCETGMAQYYFYVPWSTWHLDETSDNRGTVMKTVPVCYTDGPGAKAVHVRTFEEYLDDILNPLIQSLLTSSTLNLVYADILNLNKYEDLKLASIDVISEDYAIVPVHDPLVLKQIHNTVAMGVPAGTTESATVTVRNDVVPDPDRNAMKFSPAFPDSRHYGTSDPEHNLGDHRLIDTDTSNPDLTEKIEITRYSASHTNTFVTIAQQECSIYDPIPDHYAVMFTIYTNEIDDDHAWSFISDFISTEYPASDKLALLSQFDWHPILYCYKQATGQPNVATISHVVADLNSFTVVDVRYLQRLNTIIYMDLFEYR